MVSFPLCPGETQAVPSTSRTGARAGFPCMGKAGTCGPQGAAHRRPWCPLTWEGIWEPGVVRSRRLSLDNGPVPSQVHNVRLPAGLKGPGRKTPVQPQTQPQTQPHRKATLRAPSGHTETPGHTTHCGMKRATRGLWPTQPSPYPAREAGRREMDAREGGRGQFLRLPLGERRGEGRWRRRAPLPLPLPLAAAAVRDGERGECLRSPGGRSRTGQDKAGEPSLPGSGGCPGPPWSLPPHAGLVRASPRSCPTRVRLAAESVPLPRRGRFPLRVFAGLGRKTHAFSPRLVLFCGCEGCAPAAPGSRLCRNKQRTLSLRGFLWTLGRCDRMGWKEKIKQNPACSQSHCPACLLRCFKNSATVQSFCQYRSEFRTGGRWPCSAGRWPCPRLALGSEQLLPLPRARFHPEWGSWACA